MTCLFCRCNTWASKHRPATIKSKQQTVPCPIQYSEGGGWEAHVICPSKFFSLQPSSVFTSQTNTFLNFTIATLTIPPTTLSPLLSAGLPAATTTFIHTLRSLAYSKGQRSATMTTSSSTNRRPPINTWHLWGEKRDWRKWEAFFSNERLLNKKENPTKGSSRRLNCSIFPLCLLQEGKWEQHFQHRDHFRISRVKDCHVSCFL